MDSQTNSDDHSCKGKKGTTFISEIKLPNTCMKEERINPLTNPYSIAVRDALIVQSVLGVLSHVVLDGGVLIQMWCLSMPAYWAMTIMLLVRSRTKPNKVDPYVIRWAFILIQLALTPAVAILVWKCQNKL